jgi:hypothetical protein
MPLWVATLFLETHIYDSTSHYSTVVPAHNSSEHYYIIKAILKHSLGYKYIIYHLFLILLLLTDVLNSLFCMSYYSVAT